VNNIGMLLLELFGPHRFVKCPLRANTGSSSYEHVTFNHGVEGSSPSALTNEINKLVSFKAFR
jgi:hypothetical protein